MNSESLKREYPEIEVVILDVTDWNKTERVLNHFGPIDLVVNNAGICISNPLTDIAEDDFDR